MFSPPPPFGYSFSGTSNGFFKMSSGQKGFYWHLPWSTLTGCEVDISLFEDRKELKISNNPFIGSQTN